MGSITKKRNRSKRYMRNKSSKGNITQRKRQGIKNKKTSVKNIKQNHMNINNKKEHSSVNSNLILSNLEKKKKGTLKNINYRYFSQQFH